MRYLLLLIFSIQSNAFLLGFQGQSQSSSQFPSVVFGPNNLVTRTAGSQSLFETGNKNILSNPGFEHLDYDASWTTSGAATLSEETTVVLFGEKSFEASASGNSFNLSQDSTLYASQYADGNVQGVASVWVNNTNPSVQVCSRNAGSDVDCVDVETDGEWNFYSIPMILGATSNGIVIKSTTAAGITYIDEAYVGVGLPSTFEVCSDNISCSTTFGARFDGGGSLLSESVDWIDGNATASSPYTVTFESGIFTVTPSCVASPRVDGSSLLSLRIDSISTTQVVVKLLNTSDSDTDQAFELICHKQGIDYTNAINNKVPTFFGNCNNLEDCTDVFSAKVSSGGVVSEENIDWLNGNCDATSPYTCNFNSGIFNNAPNCVAVSSRSNGLNRTITVNSETTSSVEIITATANSTSSVATDESFRLFCQKTGDDFTNSKNPVIVGTFNEAVISPGTPRPTICSFYIGTDMSTACTASPCATFNEVGDCIGSVSRLNVGEYRVSWNAGHWGQQPACVATPVSGSDDTTPISTATGTTSLDFRNRSGGTVTDRVISVICHGAR